MNFFGGDRPDKVIQIPLNQIKINPYQPRKEFDLQKLEELSQSIKDIGLLQPIVVRKKDHGYELIAGERRLRASKLAELKKIPALVKNFTDNEIARAALIENIQRENLNPLEEALAFNSLLKTFKMTQAELAKQVGKSQSTIANKMRLLKLPDDVKGLISGGQLTERHGRALLVLPEQQRSEIAQTIIDQGWNVRQTVKNIETMVEVAATAERIAKRRPVVIRDVRIFVNAITSAYKSMKEAGIEAELNQNESDEYHEFVIKIPK